MTRTKQKSKMLGRLVRASLAARNRTWTDAKINQKAAHVCHICDDGEELIICQGPCLRQFHRTSESEGAQENNCPGVGLQSDHRGYWKCPDCAQYMSTCANVESMEQWQVARTMNLKKSGNVQTNTVLGFIA
jgi:ribosomal protein L37AE/L43A